MTRPVSPWAATGGAVVLFLVLIQPNHPGAMTWGALRVFPLELPVILLLLLALGTGVGGRILRALLVPVLVLIFALKVADYAMFTALGRGFNPVADVALIDASVRLLASSIGPVRTGAVMLGALGATLLVAAALWWAMGCWMRLAPRRPAPRLAAGGVAALAGLVMVAEVGHTMGRWSLPQPPPGTAFTARVGAERMALARRTWADLRAFDLAARSDPFAGQAGLYDLVDTDVLVLFVESYGRTSLDTPFYAQTHRATLARAEAALSEAGLAIRSGLLRAPTRGGQSWLSHTTFATGLWTDDQARYLAALGSGRQGLFHLARDAGFHTAAVMPAITQDWPEALGMGFDTILAAEDLGYAGRTFNWVTMPDQFTLAALDRILRGPGRTQRVFAQVALISSHAPWVPVPRMLDWTDLGDGTVFDAMAGAGDPPEVVWRDPDRVRAAYRDSIDYALQTVFAYVARQADDLPLVFVLGDHQAAGFVAMDDRAEVPIHVIGPAHLVDRVAAWGWTDGLIPDGTLPAVPMDEMRGRILRTFSGPTRDTETRT